MAPGGGEDSLFDLSRSISCIRVIMHIVKRLFEPRGKSLDCLNTSFRYKFYNPQFPYMQFYCWNYFDIFNATWNLRQQMNYDWKFTSPLLRKKSPWSTKRIYMSFLLCGLPSALSDCLLLTIWCRNDNSLLFVFFTRVWHHVQPQIVIICNFLITSNAP